MKYILIALLLLSSAIFSSCAQTTSTESIPTGVGVTFVADSGYRLENASVPFVMALDDGTYRIFFSPTSNESSNTAISTDCLTFSAEVINTVRGVGGDTTIIKPGNFYRMFYIDQSKTGNTFNYSRVKTGTSESGLDFSSNNYIVYAGGESDNNIVGVPDEIILSDDKQTVRMFYVGDYTGKNNIRTAISYDGGASFTFEAGNICGDDNAGGGGRSHVDPDIIKLPNGTYRLYTMSSNDGTSRIYSFSSTDCKTFTREGGIRLSPSDFNEFTVERLYDPEAVILPSGAIRLFCGATVTGQSGLVIVSATSNQ